MSQLFKNSQMSWVGRLTLGTTLLLGANSALAELKPIASYKVYTFDFPQSQVSFILRQTVRTTDSCNRFSISGDLRKIEAPEGWYVDDQDYVADFAVGSTQVGCLDDDLKKFRTLKLESEALVIKAGDSGMIRGRIWVPADMQLEVIKR